MQLSLKSFKPVVLATAMASQAFAQERLPLIPGRAPLPIEILLGNKAIPFGKQIDTDPLFPNSKIHLPKDVDPNSEYALVLTACFLHARSSNLIDLFYATNNPEVFDKQNSAEAKSNVTENLKRFCEVVNGLDNLLRNEKSPNILMVSPRVFGEEYIDFLGSKTHSYDDLLRKALVGLLRGDAKIRLGLREPMAVVRENGQKFSNAIEKRLFIDKSKLDLLLKQDQALVVKAYGILHGRDPKEKVILDDGRLERFELPGAQTLINRAQSSESLASLFRALRRFDESKRSQILAGYFMRCGFYFLTTDKTMPVNQ